MSGAITPATRLIYASIFAVLFLISTADCKKKRDPGDPVVPFFIFGDSFLDPGNNNYINTTTLDQANFWPYGETYFKHPTGRFSDGRLVSDFIAKYANLAPIPPFLQPGIDEYLYNGVNFASGGAGVLVETFQGDVIDLKTQLRNYKKVEDLLKHMLGDDGGEMAMSRAVYLFSIGTNDYISPFLVNSSLFNPNSHSKYVGMVINNLTTVVKEIYDTGGRKFAFMNLPVLGCLPIIRILKQDDSGSCLKEPSLLAELHNRALSKLLSRLEKQLKGFKYSLFDTNTFLAQRMKHPSKYGFKEGKSACCGSGRFRGVYSCGGKRIVKEFELCKNPNKHLFWDSIHLTEKAYKQLADQMWHGSVGSPHLLGSYSIKKLFQIQA